MRTCTCCKVEKLEECFYQDKRGRGGLASQCKSCKDAASVAWKKLETPARVQERKDKKQEADKLAKDGLKICSHCKEIKLIQFFNKNPYRKDGLSYYCKSCSSVANREARLRLTPEERTRRHFEGQLRFAYGLEPEDFAQIKLNQQNKCAVCSVVFKESPHVDHCHKTGKIRGLLCRFCNQGMGMFRDAPENLRAAAKYLDKANHLK